MYIWWQVWEIYRRLFQVSFVVLVRIVDDRFDLVYSLSVSFFAVVLQAYFNPFIEDGDDRLQV
jgi:hypothetical protein